MSEQFNNIELMSSGGSVIHKIKDIKVIVATGGKTASTSLFLSFNRIVPTLHTHTDAYLQQTNPKYKDMTVGKIIAHNWMNGKKILIVSCYREPVSRRISSFFHNICEHMGCDRNAVLAMDLGVIINKFLEVCIEIENYWPLFDKEDYKLFGGVNIYHKSFNKDEGFQTYENERVKILLLRFDKINRFDEIVVGNTEYANFKLVMDNVADEKWYSDLYARFKRRLIIPPHKLDVLFGRTCEEKSLRYCYHSDYVSGLKEYWYSRVK